MLARFERSHRDFGVQIMRDADMHSVDIIPADQVMPIGLSFRVLFAHGFFQLFFVNIAHSAQFGILQLFQRMEMIA